jgi:hypothetical protein
VDRSGSFVESLQTCSQGVRPLSVAMINIIPGACEFERAGTKALAIGDSALDLFERCTWITRVGKMDSIAGEDRSLQHMWPA